MRFFRNFLPAILSLLFASSLVGSLPAEIRASSPLLEIWQKECGYENWYFESFGDYIRDRYYMPLNVEIDSFIENSAAYAEEIMEMLKGENPHIDPTFHGFSDLVDQFSIRDIPVIIQGNARSYTFMTRTIESKENHKLRFILFSFYGNTQSEGGVTSPWSPRSSVEIGMAPLEVLKALQEHIGVDSMMCCSLGGICLDALKHVGEDFLPSTIIWNRALTSTWKGGMSFFSLPQNYMLYLATSYFGLDADPESSLIEFCKRSKPKEIVTIEVTHDRYFSGESALDRSFFEELRNANMEVRQGLFFIPMLAPIAQHACRLDHILNNENTGTSTKNFFPMKKNQPLSDGLIENIFSKGTGHTCFVIGGNKDNLDSITYLQVLPLLCSYSKLSSGKG